jgi:hypothetical protein
MLFLNLVALSLAIPVNPSLPVKAANKISLDGITIIANGMKLKPKTISTIPPILKKPSKVKGIGHTVGVSVKFKKAREMQAAIDDLVGPKSSIPTFEEISNAEILLSMKKDDKPWKKS